MTRLATRIHLHLILVALLANSCTGTLDPSAREPPFFFAVVDGQPWTPTGLTPNTNAQCQLPDILTFGADHRSADGSALYSLIAVSIEAFHGVGIYQLRGASGSYGVYRVLHNLTLDLQFTDSSTTNYVQVTDVDTAAHLVAGTFAFRTVAHDTVTIISGGAFHLQYDINTTVSNTGWCAK